MGKQNLVEHSFSTKNPGAFQAENGVMNIFGEFSDLKNHFENNDGCTHPLTDEENELGYETRYSNDYNQMVEEFGGYGFHITTHP